MDANEQVYFYNEQNIPQEDVDRYQNALHAERDQVLASMAKSLEDFERQAFKRERQRDAESR